MNKLVAALLAASTLAPLAYAEQPSPYYAGLTLTKSGQANGISRTGERVSDDGRVGVKAFAGYSLSPSFAIEAGYGDYGRYVLNNTGTGASGDASIDVRMFYLAAKGTHMFTERFGVFGKLGVAHSRFDQHGLALGDVTMTRAMYGVGLQYNITQQVALTLEVDKYGKKSVGPRTHYNLNKLEAGLKFSF